MSHRSQSNPHLSPPPVLDLNAVAALLQLTPDRFRNIRRRLEAAGFPKSLPILTGRWSHDQVMQWIATNGAPDQPTAATSSAIEAAARRLDERYGGRVA